MKTTISTRAFDAAEYLTTEASIAAFVSDAMESGEPEAIQLAINTAARARGMAQIAEDSGLGRESLYKALRPDAKPQFGTIVKVLGALGVKLVVEPVVRTPTRARKAQSTMDETVRVKVKGSKPYKPAAKAAAKKAPVKRRSVAQI